jgi:RND family efflux transporter MFP subunit
MCHRLLLGAAIAASLALATAGSFAHDGIDHSQPNAPVHAAPIAQQAGFAAEGAAFQAVLVPGDGTTLLYLADADSNAPIGGAAIEAEGGGWQGMATPTATDGVYLLAWSPGSTGTDITLVVTAGSRDDLLLLQGVRVIPPAAPGGEGAVAHWTHWTGGGAIGAVLVAILLAVMRRRGAAAVVLLVMILSAPAFAHGGEDHGAPAAAKPPVEPGTPFVLPKATQFLLGIRTERIEPREAADTVRVVGRVVPDPSGYARVQPSQPARVVADPAFPIPVPGEHVRKGQVLAVLEPTLSSLERGDKRAVLSRVDSQIAITERELARQVTLGDLVPAKQLETTRIQLDQLRKERGQLVGTALGRELLTAPLDGIVTDVHVVPGEVVTTTQALVEVIDPDKLRVEAVVHDLPLARRISAATAATKLLPGEIFPLALLGVSPKLDPIDQGVHAVFRVEGGRAAQLSVGMPVDVFLATGSASLRTAVPRDAVAEVGGRQVVFVRTGPETFEARPVKVEKVVGPLAELSGGIKAGDRVVTQGIEQIKAGR